MANKKNTPVHEDGAKTSVKAAEAACEAPDEAGGVGAPGQPGEGQEAVQKGGEGTYPPDDRGLESPEAPGEGTETVPKTGVVAAPTGLRLRSGPGKVYPVVKILPNGSVVTLTGGEVELNGVTWLSVDAGADAGWVDSAWVR